MDVNSWFEGGTAEGRIDEIELDKDVTTVSMSRASRPERQEQTDWWRMLSLRISNCSAGVYARKGPEDNVFLSALNEPVDLSLVLQKSAWQNRGLSLRGKLSVVNMSLKYSEYCLINAVIKGNVGRKVDPSAWDNMEKAYDLEQNSEKDDSQPNQTAMHPSKHVEYASGARRIRYGAKAIQAKTQPAQDSKPEDEGSNSIDVKFLLDGFALKLHRDDYVEESGEANTSSSIGYDMILLRVQVVEVSIVGKASNDISLHLSLYRVGLFDLGDRGRLVREALIRKRGERKRGRIKELRSPCAFHVLVEGYSPPKRGASEVEKSIFGPGQNDAQLVITVDRVPATSVGTIGSLENPAQDRNDNGKVTIARVVVNFLTVNALIRPLKEVLAFFAMSWQAKNNTGVSQRDLDHGTGSTFTKAVHQENERARKLSISNKSTVSCLQIKIVLHYPRLFFVADESDPHSRALVLRG